MNVFLLRCKVRKKLWMFTFIISIQHCIAQSVKKKDSQFGNKKIKHSLYAHSMILLCRKFDGIIKPTTGQKLKQWEETLFRNYCNMKKRPHYRTGIHSECSMDKWGLIAKEQGVVNGWKWLRGNTKGRGVWLQTDPTGLILAEGRPGKTDVNWGTGLWSDIVNEQIMRVRDSL